LTASYTLLHISVSFIAKKFRVPVRNASSSYNTNNDLLTLYSDEYGHRFLIKYRHSPDLEAIVKKKKGFLLGVIIHLQIEKRENVERSITDALFGTRAIETCNECGGIGGSNAIFIHCLKCGPEFVLCDSCYTGHSSQFFHLFYM